MRLVIDHDVCTGHGRCYALGPALVGDDDAGYGQVLGDGSVTAADRDLAERLVAACPEGALSLVEAPEA
jgi:ferredoxin